MPNRPAARASRPFGCRGSSLSRRASPILASRSPKSPRRADPAERLADFNPPQKGYRALREELRRLAEAGRRGAQDDTVVELTAGALDEPPLVDNNVESPHPRLKTARGRLKGLVRGGGYTPPSTDRAQARRRAAILANMEMWRWEPRDMGERRIEVNVPDFTVAMLDGDATVHERADRRRQAGHADADLFQRDALCADQSRPGRCPIPSSGRRCCRGWRRIPITSGVAAMK